MKRITLALPSPYVGLRPFGEADAILFFGRDAHVRELLGKLERRQRFLAVLGASGTGKSSLVRAGLVPALHRGALHAPAGSDAPTEVGRWNVCIFNPGDAPLARLAHALSEDLRWTDGVDRDVADSSLAALLGTSPRALANLYRQKMAAFAGTSLLLVVDQFEEIFRYRQRGPDEADRFVRLLLRSAIEDVPIYVVMTMRSDFLGNAVAIHGLPEAINDGIYLTPRLRADELTSVVTSPLALVGGSIDPVLANRLVNTLSAEDELPVLEHALLRMWDRARAEQRTRIELEDFSAVCSPPAQPGEPQLNFAIDNHAEQIFSRLAPEQQLVARQLFLALVDRREGRALRRPQTLHELNALVGERHRRALADVIEAFRAEGVGFVLPAPGRSLVPEALVDISHESLIRRWRRFQQWISAERLDISELAEWQQRAERQRAGGGWLDENDCERAQQWRARIAKYDNRAMWAERHAGSNSYALVDDYIRASLERVAQVRRRERRRSLLRKATAGSLIVGLAFVAGTLFVFKQQADRQRDDAESARVQSAQAKDQARSSEREALAAKNQADMDRSRAEKLVAFLIGERLLAKLRPVGRNEILQEVQTEVQDYLSVGADKLSPAGQRARGLALRNEGDLLRMRGDTASAAAKYEDSVTLFGQLATGEGRDQIEEERARSLARLGTVLQSQGRLTQALDHFRDALATWQRLVTEDKRSSDVAAELAAAHNDVAGVLVRMGQPREALKEHLDPALALVHVDAGQTALPARVLQARFDALNNRSTALELLADEAGNLRAAVAADNVAKLWMRVYPLSADARQAFAVSTANRANIRRAQGANLEASAQYEQLVAAMDELVRWDPTNESWARDLLMSRLLRAESQSEQAQLDAARRSMEAISRQLLALAQKDPYNVDRKMDLTWVFRALADNATARKDWPEAMRLLDTANNHATQAIAAAPSDIILQREKAWIMYRQAAVQVSADHARQAALAATQTRVEFARLLRAAPSDLVLQSDLVLATHAERDALADAKDEAGAARAASQHRRALAGALRALPASGTLQTEAYWADLRDGDRFSIVKQPERALAFFRTALEHISRATQIDPDNALWWQWRYQAARRCSEMLAKLKRWDEAEQSDRVGLAAIENASKLLPRSPEVADKLGTSHLSLGRDLASLGRLEAALAEFDKAYEAATLATQLGSDVSAYRERRREVVDEMARTKVLQKDRDGYQRIFTNAGRSERRALEGLRDEKIRTARTIEVIEWHIRAGQAHAEKKEADDALGRYAMARRWIDRGIADAADDTPLIAQLSRLQRLVGEQMAAKGDAAGQMAALKEGLDALVKESERRSDAASFEALRDYHHVMADAYASTKQWEDAESQWQAGADAGVHAAELGQTADHYNAAALSLYRLGNFYDTRGSWERAASAYGRAIAELEIAVQKDPKGVFHRIGMSACRRRLGLALEAQKRPQEARVAFKEAIAAATEALTLEPDAGEQLQHLYLAQWRLADNYANAGLADDANVLYESAKENAVRAAKKKPADTGIPVDIDALRSHRSADVEPR